MKHRAFFSCFFLFTVDGDGISAVDDKQETKVKKIPITS